METPPAEKLLKKILELEESQKHLKKEMSRLKVTAELRQQSYSVSPGIPARRNIGEGAPAWRKSGAASFRHSGPFKKEKEESCIQSLKNSRAGVDGEESSAKKFTDQQYLNILQSMAQSVHAFDLNMQIIFWNAMSEKLYGYTAEEVVGKNPINVMVDDRDAAFAMNVAQRCVNGESWTGEFPVKTKSGKIFSAVTTCSPFYDDNCSLVGIISITSSSAPFQDSRVSLAQLKAQECETSSISSNNTFASKLGLNTKGSVTSKLGIDSDQPIQVAIASKISYLASKVSKVRSKMRAYDNSATLSEGVFGADHRDDAASTSGASTPRGDFIKFPFGVFTYNDETFPSKPLRESEGESKIRTKDKECMVKKVLSWPWQGNEQESSKRKPTDSAWPWLQNEQEKGKSESCNNRTNNTEASSLCSSSLNMNSTNSFSSCASTSNRFMNKADTYRHCSEYEILWDDLTIGDHIGQGSCGTVYHGVWFGSDVAVKVFSKQEYSEEIIQSFRQEVSMMKRLRHPNVLLFMGAVTSPQRLCTVSEFLPRGSLFRLLQRSTSKLDWRRRIHMALDIARAMNYLHHCNPPIIHRDLKSSNLLVDKNLTVKVADFGLARIKHETYLTTKSGKGTPQWMAPEVLRNESCDEKSDIYSYGVVLWELATEKIPWESLNSMQVIGAVGFMNQRLEIPKDIDPRWISLIKSCWHSDTKLRPTFQELIEELRDLQREYTMKYQATRAWVS